MTVFRILRRSAPALLIVCALGLPGCGATEVPFEDGGGLDGGREADDARVPSDSGAGLNAGSDAPAVRPDGGDADEDGDGVFAGLDCDDTDPAIGTAAERDCTSACGTGAETCVDGRWSDCSAPVDCLCETPAAMRVIDCGNCGTKAQRCSESAWEDTSLCLNEGACSPGAVETQENDYCEERQRLCTTACEWGAWSVTRPAGECRRGTTDCPISCSFGSRGYTCDDMCVAGPPPETCLVMCD